MRNSATALARQIIVVAVAVLGALSSVPSTAQIPAPPVIQHSDSNGVDPVTGSYNTRATDLSIGPAGSRGLTYERYWVGAGWLSSVIATMSGKGANPAVSFGGTTETFTRSGSVYQNDGSSSSSLSRAGAGADYIYTSANGTIIRFMPSTGGTLSYYDSQIAWARSITWPDGTVENFYYKTGSYSVPMPGGGTSSVILGRLQSVTNSLGYQLKFSYAANTLSSSNVDAWQNPTRVTAINNGAEYCSPTADSCSLANAWPHADYTYAPGSSYSHLMSATDAAGRTWNYGYLGDALSSIRRPGASADDVVIGYAGGVSSVQRAGQTWNYSRVDGPSYSRTTTITDPASHSRTVASNTLYSIISSQTDENSKTTSYQYTGTSSVLDLISKITLPEGNSTEYTYDARANVTSVIQHAKPGSGLADLTTSAGYPTSCASLITCNKPSWTKDPLGNQTDYTYDPTHGGVLTLTAPAPTSGAVRPQTRYNYSTVQAYYMNAAGSIVASGLPTYVLTQISACQANASCAGTADEVRSTIAYGPQVAGTASNLLPVSTSAGAGDGSLTATTTYQYDSIGNRTYTDGPLAGIADTTRTIYDAARQVVGVIGPDPDGSGSLNNPAKRITYNSDGTTNLIERGTTTGQSDANWSAFSPLQQATSTYDAYGRKTVDAVGASGTIYAETQYSYDVLGRLQCTAVRMNSTAWSSLPASACTLGTTGSFGPDRIARSTYDNVGQVTLVQSAFGTSDQVNEAASTYTGNGKVATVTDANGNVTSYTYDGFDRLAEEHFPSPTTSGSSNSLDYEGYAYDADGNRTAWRHRDGRLFTFTYDALRRMTVKYVPDGCAAIQVGPCPSASATRDVYFGYDNLSRPLFARFDSTTGEGVSSSYDALSRVASSTITMGGVSRTLSYLYDAGGNRTRITHPDGVYFNMTYDALSRLTYSSWWAPASGTVSFFGLNYDALGRRTSTGRASSVTGYSYDPVDRLATINQQFAGGTGNVSTGFTYNPAGQISSLTRDNDDYAFSGNVNVDRSYATNGLNQYTSAGAATFSYDATGNLVGDGTNSYAYDAENRLIGNGAGVTLAYDPLGRLWRTAGGALGKTDFLYDGDQLAVEYDGDTGAMRRRYMFAGQDEPILWDEGSAMNCSTTRFLHTDQQGSIVALADCFGNRTNVNSYDEYGIPAASNFSSSLRQRFQYTGQAWIPELGMYYYKARLYSPTLGRFMQTDPIGYGVGLNWYNYVDADPVNSVDSSGLCTGSLISGDDGSCFGGGFIDGAGSCIGNCSSGGERGSGSGSGAVGGQSGLYHWADLQVGNGAWRPVYISGSSSGLGLMGQFGIPAGNGSQPQNDSNDVVVTGRRQVAADITPSEVLLHLGLERLGLGEIGLLVWLLEPSEACCFTAGTPVLTPTGLRTIETLTVGDMVMSRDPKTGETAAKPIVRIIPAHERRIWTVTVSYKDENGRWMDERYETTDDHPWRTTDGRWLTSASLNHGQLLARESGTAVVANVHDTGATKLTYNLSIADYHTYFIGKAETWVHNSCPPEFTPHGRAVKVNLKNKLLLAQLRQNGRRDWYKVYQDGYVNGEPWSYHYFQDDIGTVFDPKLKPGWSNQ